VRYGRVPKRSREKEEQERRVSTTGEPGQTELETKQLAIYDIILTISQAHCSNCTFTEDKMKLMLRKPAQFSMKFEGDLLSTQDAIDQQKMYFGQQLASLITPSISRVVEFAKRVPGSATIAVRPFSNQCRAPIITRNSINLLFKLMRDGRRKYAK
ncbi:PREDICTED: ecdysone-induced protein 78C-like, partial [Priapulus caudatus]|uniref:Ecdysone-induced protein 78C-like n=1 Tax=Priapulus caudatus TaxID=37621 RepID=A0ABM1EWB2_PRICU